MNDVADLIAFQHVVVITVRARQCRMTFFKQADDRAQDRVSLPCWIPGMHDHAVVSFRMRISAGLTWVAVNGERFSPRMACSRERSTMRFAVFFEEST
jgi:hypothetical protein